MTIVALGGSTRPNSSSERLLLCCLEFARRFGVRSVLLGAGELQLPFYAPERPERTAEARHLVETLRTADALIVASPGYHGGMSGLVKNALDYAEDLREDVQPYLDGRPVGCIACASGWQATVTTLVALRSTVHALRGWPAPLGVAVNSSEPIWDDSGRLADARTRQNLEALVTQVIEFASHRSASMS